MRTFILNFATLAAFVTLLLTHSAFANPTYTFHENLHVGQKITVSESTDTHRKFAWTTNGVADPTDTRQSSHWKITLTIEEQKDGSDIQAVAYVDPDSYNTAQEAGQDEKKTACSFAGKSIRLTRLPDESFTNDFKGKASPEDLDALNNFLSPDQDFYPDKPVSIGDVWDNSAKLSKHSQLGPNDQLLSECKLDWVKTIDGKPMAQISNAVAIIYHLDNNVEEDVEGTAVLLVDMSSQMIVKADQKGATKYSNPASDSSKISGGSEYTTHDEVLPTAQTQP